MTLRIAFYLCIGALSISGMSMAASSAAVAKFSYTVTNQTNMGARVVVMNDKCKENISCPPVFVWVPAGTQESLTIERPAECSLVAQFFDHAPGESLTQRPAFVAQTSAYLHSGSKGRLVEANGRYVWAQ